MRLVQLTHPTEGRCVALVEEPSLRLLEGCASVYRLAQAAIASGRGIAGEVAVADAAGRSTRTLAYDEVYDGASPWRLLPPFDHPDEPARCLVTGTHTGESLGRPSTGKPVIFHGMTMVRLKDGKIVESWNNFDFMTMYKQLE